MVGGLNAYVKNNPVNSIDPMGLDTLIIYSQYEKGSTNIFAHVAPAFTGSGVYSIGTCELFGSKASTYLFNQLSRRYVTIYRLQTGFVQEQQMIKSMKK